MCLHNFRERELASSFLSYPSLLFIHQLPLLNHFSSRTELDGGEIPECDNIQRMVDDDVYIFFRKLREASD
jgi:hypothetical protein